MPRAPILSRELFYTKNPDGSYRLLDWCLVNTSLGGMIEPRNLNAINGGRVRGVDAFGADSFTKISEMNEDEFYRKFNLNGRQIPVTFAR